MQKKFLVRVVDEKKNQWNFFFFQLSLPQAYKSNTDCTKWKLENFLKKKKKNFWKLCFITMYVQCHPVSALASAVVSQLGMRSVQLRNTICNRVKPVELLSFCRAVKPGVQVQWSTRVIFYGCCLLLVLRSYLCLQK